MKKFTIFFLLLFLFFFCFARPTKAENKCGVNIGPKYNQVDQVASLVKNGGWVVSLGSPGNCSDFETLFGKDLNVIIRSYNGGRAFTKEQAKGWVATLGKMDTKGQKIYLMPWNEPNHANEGGGENAGKQVYDYSLFLKNELQQAGLLGTKVILLSPMVDKLNPSFDGGFFNEIDKNTFYKLFEGSSINEYDQWQGGPCRADKNLNNCLYDQIGIPAPYYAPEAGVAGTCTPPCYEDDKIASMLNYVWENKWKNDSNFKMFAVFSYDPHRPGNWNLFNSSATKEFYRNCQAGPVYQGTANESAFNSWFEANKNGLVSCGGCGYAPSEDFCTAAGDALTQPEIIDLQDNLICTDFDFETKTESEFSSQGNDTSGGGDVRGVFEMPNLTLPNLEGMLAYLVNGFQNLIPGELMANAGVGGKMELEGSAKHFIEGKNSSSENDEKSDETKPIPKSKTNFPEWWARLIGMNYLLKFLDASKSSPASMQVVIQHSNTASYSQKSRCPGGTISSSTTATNGVETIEKNFATNTFLEVVWETIKRIIDQIQTTLFKKRTTAYLRDKTRGNLPGGSTFNQNQFLNYSLPSDLVLGGRDSFLAADGTFSYSAEGTSQNSNTNSSVQGAQSEKRNVNYKLGKSTRYYCLNLCLLYPSGTDISSIDKICPSCNPDDYPLTESGFDDNIDDTTGCTPDANNACDYVDNALNEEMRRKDPCSGDPICESGKCYPFMWRQAKDYAAIGCPVPYGAPDCTAVCVKAKFPKNPAGGFGPCRYQNADVCLRPDREKCADLCNWACCAGK